MPIGLSFSEGTRGDSEEGVVASGATNGEGDDVGRGGESGVADGVLG